MDMRVSRVAPMVENNIVELVDMVKQLGRRKGDMTESQNRRMVVCKSLQITLFLN